LRYDIALSYQLSRVPGLLDADTAEDLNTVTMEYTRDHILLADPTVHVFIDNVELLSQTILHREGRRMPSINSLQNRNQSRRLDDLVNLWVTLAFRGFAFNLTEEVTTNLISDAIDSPGYTMAIRNSGNPALTKSYVTAEGEDSITPLLEDVPEDGTGSSAAIVIVVVVFILVVACGVSAHFYHKRSNKGLPCITARRKEADRDVQPSPESLNMASQVGSMFSFDDTATAGTNGLMRFISSVSRSKDSTGSGNTTNSAQESFQNEVDVDDLDDVGVVPDEDLGHLTPTILEEEEPTTTCSSTDEEEPHPLTGIIPPMIVYDHIDGEGKNELDGLKNKRRDVSVVPSRRVEASSSFKAVLESRGRPTAASDLAEYFSETSDFVTDPSLQRWDDIGSRPSPIGIMMDSDGDDVSVASTPARLYESDSETKSHRKTKSFDDCSIIESVRDILLLSPELDIGATPSPSEIGGLSIPSEALGNRMKVKQRPMASLPLATNDIASGTADAGYDIKLDHDPSIGTAVEKGQPRSLTLRGNVKNAGAACDTKNSFWSRSPIAKGVKDAFWSTKRIDLVQSRRNAGAPPSTPTKNEEGSRWLAPSPPTGKEPTSRLGGPQFGLPATRPEYPAVDRRCSTPTRLESQGKRIPTPPRDYHAVRSGASPVIVPVHSISEESLGEIQQSLRSLSGSFGTAQESLEDEVTFEFRAQRIGKLGMVINSTPRTGPFVEQVKDYSTLFGRILAGDRIVEVDGVETVNMKIKEVTKRLSGKYGIRATSGEVRIKVARAREWAEEAQSQRSDNSNGSVAGYQSHHRSCSEPEPLSDRASMNSMNEHHRLFSYSRSGEEV
jgi:hypothetical protein